MVSYEWNYRTFEKGTCKQLALSQEDFTCKLGVSFTTISHWENGLFKPCKLVRATSDAFYERMQEAGMLNLPETGRGC
jgi:transcriptional regulator with XRE-family HTH domain